MNLSLLFYYVLTLGINECASPCSNWIIDSLRISLPCIEVCIEGPNPNPLFFHTFWLAVGLWIVGGVIWIRSSLTK